MMYTHSKIAQTTSIVSKPKKEIGVENKLQEKSISKERNISDNNTHQNFHCIKTIQEGDKSKKEVKIVKNDENDQDFKISEDFENFVEKQNFHYINTTIIEDTSNNTSNTIHPDNNLLVESLQSKTLIPYVETFFYYYKCPFKSLKTFNRNNR